MDREDKLAKVISICNKNLATAEEILDGCGGVCRAVLGKKKEEAIKGYLSCSITDEARLALCLWREKESGLYEKVEHFVVPLSGMTTLRGTIDIAIKQQFTDKGLKRNE